MEGERTKTMMLPMLSMHTCPCCPCTHAATCVWCLHAHACQVTGCVVCGWCPCMRCMHVTWQCEGGGWAGVEGVSAAQPPSCLLAQVSLGMFVVVVMLVVIVTVMLIGRCWAVLCMHHVHHAMNDDDDDDVLQHGMEHGVEALVKQSRWLASNVTITTTLRGNMMNETGCMEGFGTRMGIWKYGSMEYTQQQSKYVECTCTHTHASWPRHSCTVHRHGTRNS